MIVTGVIAAASAAPVLAQANWVVWSQPQNTTYATVPSSVSVDPPVDVEIADDFQVFGTVSRIVVNGWDCFYCAQPDVAGAFVRFYEWTVTGPGALQSEFFVPDGPGLMYSPAYPASLDITLPKAFVANGKHFMSVQLAFVGGGSWEWWITNHNSPQGVQALTRNRLAGPDAPWTPLPGSLGPLNCDMPFMLWGDDGYPPPPGTDPCGAWVVTPTPNPGNTTHAILRDVHAISTDDVWAVGEYTAMVQGSSVALSMALHWDGNAWTHIPSPNPTACNGCEWVTFDTVTAGGPNDVWAGGGKRVQGLDGFMGTHLYVARYDGENWIVMNTPLTSGGSGSNVQDIEYIAPDDIWFFGDWMNPNAGQSYRALAMHWNGSSFTVYTTPFPSGGTPGWGLMAGSAIAPDDIWAVGGGSDGDYSATGYLIHWDGSSWTRVLGPAPGTYQRLYDVKMIASDDVWAVGDYFDVNQGGYFPLFLHWDGSSWTQVESPGGGRGLVVFDSNNIYSGGGGIVHWDGTSWELVEQFNSVIGPSIAGISAAGLCDMWAVGRQIIAGDILNFAAQLRPGSQGQFSVLGDLTGDGFVGVPDLLMVINNWGACPASPAACLADIAPGSGGDGTVGVLDLLMVINNWS